MRPASSRATTRCRRRRRCRNGRRRAASAATLPGAIAAASEWTTSNTLLRAPAPKPAASTVTTTAAPGATPRRSMTSRASGARWAARVSHSETPHRLGREERKVLRACYGFRTTLNGELSVDVLQVRLHGLRRDAQGPSDLLVRLTLVHQLQDCSLARGQGAAGPRGG